MTKLRGRRGAGFIKFLFRGRHDEGTNGTFFLFGVEGEKSVQDLRILF